jgi:hypothetical protein
LDVDAQDAVDVVGILAGLKPSKDPFKDGEGWATAVTGAKANPSTFDIGFGELNINGKLVDGDDRHSCYFHHCARFKGKLYNTVSCTATPFWCAICKGLVKFFGGFVMYNDCGDEKGKNIYRSKRHCPVDRHGFIPTNGKLWYEYQEALLAMPKLSPEEIKAMMKVSAYARDFEEDGITRKERS